MTWVIFVQFMPENTIPNNENRSKNAGSEPRERFTDESLDRFETVLKKVGKRIEEKHQKQENEKTADPNQSEQFYMEDMARRAKNREEYERNKRSFNRANNSFQELRRINNDLKVRTPQEKEAQVRAESRKELKKEIEKAVKTEAEADLTMKQKMAIKIAGDEAVNVMYAIAQEMEHQVELGGPRAFMIIVLTYFIAFVKDASDAGIFWIPGAGIITGIIFGGILAFFWLLACESWHGGYVTNRIIRKILTRVLAASIFESIPLCGIVPTYLVLNLWSHMDFRKTTKEAEDKLVEANENIDNIQKTVNREIASLG